MAWSAERGPQVSPQSSLSLWLSEKTQIALGVRVMNLKGPCSFFHFLKGNFTGSEQSGARNYQVIYQCESMTQAIVTFAAVF